jgi:hypothetical protein
VREGSREEVERYDATLPGVLVPLRGDPPVTCTHQDPVSVSQKVEEDERVKMKKALKKKRNFPPEALEADQRTSTAFVFKGLGIRVT